MSRRRDRSAPYHALESHPHDAQRARNECVAARVGCKLIRLPYRITRLPGSAVASLNRALVRAGEAEIEARRGLRRARKAREVPEVCTSYGVHIERRWRYGALDAERHRLFVAVVRSKSAEAMALFAKNAGRERVMKAIVKHLTG